MAVITDMQLIVIDQEPDACGEVTVSVDRESYSTVVIMLDQRGQEITMSIEHAVAVRDALARVIDNATSPTDVSTR